MLKRLSLIFVFLVFLSSFAFAIDYQPIAFYELDNNLDWADASQDLTEAGDPDYTAGGVIGFSAQLDTVDDTLTSGTWDNNEENTTVIQFWVYHSSIQDGDGYPVFRWGDVADTDQLKINTRGNAPNQYYRATLTASGSERSALNSAAGTAVLDVWTMITWSRNSSHTCLAVDDTIEACSTDTTALDSDFTHFKINTDGGNIEDATFDNFYIGHDSGVNRNWLEATYNGGSGINFSKLPDAYSEINVTIEYPDNNTQFTPLLLADSSYNIWINITHNETSAATCSINDTLFTSQGANLAMGFNDTFKNNSALPIAERWVKVFCNKTAESENGTAIVYFSLTGNFALNSVQYGNKISHYAKNYTRSLDFEINYSCYEGINNNISIYANNESHRLYNTTCDGVTHLLTSSYNGSSEGEVNISFYFNTSSEESTLWFGNETFYLDLYDPEILVQNISREAGFSPPNVNFTMKCNDTGFENLTYFHSLNGNELHNATVLRSTPIQNETTINTGGNTYFVSCKDPFSETNSTINYSIYYKEIFLINEKENVPYNVDNASSVLLYFDDNRTVYDFKANSRNSVNFTSIAAEQLRLEITYVNGDIVTRYVDVSVDHSNELRICANNDSVTHYEQLIISATSRPVTVKSVYADCVVGQDYTRFSYEQGNVLRVLTINSLYYLYLYENNQKVYLASMDGSIQSFYNLDALEFNQRGYNLAVSGQALSFSRDGTLLTIYYRNLDNTSVRSKVTVRQWNTSDIIFQDTETGTPNQFTLNFDYSTLDIHPTTLLQIEINTTDILGQTTTLTRFFNLDGRSGIINAQLALALAIILTIAGLTFTVTRAALGWFGMIFLLSSIAVTSLAVTAWYLTLWLVIDVIILIYIVLLLTQKNYGAVA